MKIPSQEEKCHIQGTERKTGWQEYRELGEACDRSQQRSGDI